MSYGRGVKVLLCVVLTAAFAFVGGAEAARSATAPKVNPLDTAQPISACGASATMPWRGPIAHCDAWVFAGTTGKVLHLSANQMPRRDGRAIPKSVASPTVVQSVFPADLSTAYELPGTTSGSHSQVVAIVDAYDNPNVYSDLLAYDNFWRTQFGENLPDIPVCATPTSSSCFMKVNQSGASSPLPIQDPNSDKGWTIEVSLDVDAVHDLCHDCKIILVEANSPNFDDLAAAENEAVALGATVITNSYGGAEGGFDQSTFDTFAPSYRHPGVIITASTGDDGFAGGTQFPADVNDVVAVGGTQLSTNSTDSSWIGETAWFTPPSGAGSGCSVFQSPQLWQSGAIGWAATGCNTERAVADVSADASPSSGLWVWSTSTAGCPANDDPANQLNHCWFVVGGTSLASPIIAATYALASNPNGVNTEALPYQHYRDLHDVTSGSTGSCATTICRAAVGYDGPTGIGSPNGLSGFQIGPPFIGTWSPLGGADGTTLTINGENLSQASAVTIGGTPVQSFDVVSDVKITAVVGAGTTGPIRVTTPGGVGTSPGNFAFTPTISSFTPNGGGDGTTVTITGTGFVGTTAVKFGGVAAASFSVDSDTQITAATGTGTITGPVTVTGAGGTGTSSTPFYGPPSISSINPVHAPVHGTVTITGTNLSGATRVNVNNPSAAFHVVSPTQITVTVPDGHTLLLTGTIQVTTPGGTATSGTFNVDPGPAVTSMTPGTGAVGQTITITGTNLDNTVGIEVGHIITVPTSVSSTQVTFTIPPGAVTGPVTILSKSGTAGAGTLTVTG